MIYAKAVKSGIFYLQMNTSTEIFIISHSVTIIHKK